MSKNVFEVLQERGFVEQATNVDSVKRLLNEKSVIYQGFDPTKPSLHIGHLLSLMVFYHLQHAGQKMIFVLGGGTAQIGDPSGRNSSRQMITIEEINHNKIAIQHQVQKMGLIDFDGANHELPQALMIDNLEWLDMGLLEFLRLVTPHFSVNEMIKRDTFKIRLESQTNLSLLEFLYPTLQGFDFLYLFDKYGCRLQIGGNDQWANILDGVDLIRRKHQTEAHALTFPLLMDRSGNKMGKTSDGQIVWLSKDGEFSTSPFDFYQYWVKSPDEDLKRNFKLFTFISLDEIQTILSGDPREAQHRLAYEVTRIVHGDALAEKAREDSLRAFGNRHGTLEIVPTYKLSIDALSNQEIWISGILSISGAVNSLSSAKRLVQQGGVYLNGEKIMETTRNLTPNDFENNDEGKIALIKYGKGKILKLILTD